ncbi:helix-hairpin-helix domain-containing protein [Alicyclobacillus sp. SO9]|uniref:helix-hairpin-helix domain-containing protein n=1 Tax=Alicyclobacillus sp. SO9 TaxID=2665646 RepID=UPI0018E88165|nr:helix-hairpin-helix domain-containing protein [Alicyclobacillus sp. SO9]QQE77357.1 helix-hairpin-helix domain-containing protein [Alicyclobacillus sp. SO9]
MEEPQELDIQWEGQVLEGESGRKHRSLAMILIITGAVMFAAGFAVRSALTLHPKATPSSTASSHSTASSSNLPAKGPATKGLSIVVDIHGDVHKPGVYHLAQTSRVEDAVKAAGGFMHTEDANLVNLAASVDDGQEIVIPSAVHSGDGNSISDYGAHKNKSPSTTGDGGSVTHVQGKGLGDSNGSSSPSSATSVHGTIDLNTADTATLETLPGIGPGRAKAIVDFRQQHGPFHRVQDLQQVHGIGPQIFSHVKSYLLVSNK